MTRLAELLDLEEVAADGDTVDYRTVIDETFTIGPKVHGGSVQMIASKAARLALGRLAAPDADPALIDGVTTLAISSDYLAAPDPAAVDVQVRIVKRGRTVNLAHVDVTQGGRTMVSSAVTLGRLDDGEATYRRPGLLAGMPAEPGPSALRVQDTVVAEVMHLLPAVDLMHDGDTFPGGRGERGEPVIRGWIRPRDADDQPADLGLDFGVLVCDMSPPVVMNLGLYGWAPTVQLTSYVRRVPAPGWPRGRPS